MALKILLADDSMTAQNMGKKILAEAGYDVTTVSNGSAAVKKIAELHPDIILLDVYMPGYNGLEVCAKTKAAAETSSVPVLLTVGKMEPFRPEEGIKVKADGVIIKPFEATDLITVVKKLAERLQSAAVASEPEALITERKHHEFDDPSYHEWKTTTAEFHVSKEMVDAAKARYEHEGAPPQNVATTHAPAAGASAAAAPAPALASVAPATAQEFSVRADEPVTPVEAQAAPLSTDENIRSSTPLAAPPTVELSGPAFSVDAAPAEAPVAAFSLETAGASQVAPEAAAAQPAPAVIPDAAPELHELQTFDLQVEPGPVEPPPEIEFTAAAHTEVVAAADPSFEPTALQHAIEVEVGTDSALITDAQEISSAFPTHFGVAHPDEVPVGLASDIPELAEAPPGEPALDVAPDESELAIAPAEAPAFHGAEENTALTDLSKELEAAVTPDLDREVPAETAAVDAAVPAGAELSVAEELARALTPAPPPPPAPPLSLEQQLDAALPLVATAAPQPELVIAETFVPPVEEQVEPATEAVASSASEADVEGDVEVAVAAAVEAVLERMKPTLIAAILRELKG